MSKLNEYMEEQFKRYEKANDFAALALALEAAKQKYIDEMDKVHCPQSHSLNFSIYLFLSSTLTVSVLHCLSLSFHHCLTDISLHLSLSLSLSTSYVDL